jgi:hypothetical protein
MEEHRVEKPFMGIMWLVILAAGAIQHKSIGVAIDGEINGANFDGVTKGWYSYAFIVIFVCWLSYVFDYIWNWVSKKRNGKANDGKKGS